MKYRLILLVSVALLLAFESAAQRSKIKFRDRLSDTVVLRDISEKRKRVKRVPPVKNEYFFGTQLASDGYGLQFNYARAFGVDEFGEENIEKYHHDHLFRLEVGERVYPKEYIQFLENTFLGFILLNGLNQPAIYGKTANFYNAKLTYGQRRLFGGKGESGSPLVQFFYSGGLTLGLIKPYYIIHASQGKIKYTEETKRFFEETYNVQGKGGVSEGWKELQYVPGLVLRTGIHVDFAKKKTKKSAIEIGLGVELYSKKIKQYVRVPATNIFANVFCTYQIGWRR